MSTPPLSALIASAGALVLFASIALVFTFVITSLVLGGPIDFPGGPEVANANNPGGDALAR